MDRRNFVIGTAASAATLVGGQAMAQDKYPSHAITMISPFPPGGVSDTITRPLDAALEAVFKQPVVLENKTGAAGAVGAQFVAAAKPDGYTLLSTYRLDFRLRRGRQIVRPAAEIHQCRLHPARAHRRRSDRDDRQQGPALQDAEGPGRRRQGQSQQGDLQLVGPLRRARTFRPRCSPRRPAICRCAICRPMAAAPRSPRCSAATSTSSCRRRRSRCRISAPARCARWRCRARSASRRCPTCRPSRSWATTSNIISGSACSRRRARRRRSSHTLREALNKAAHSKQFLDTLDQSRPGARVYGPAGIREVLGRRRQAPGRRDQRHRPRAGMILMIAGAPPTAGLEISQA